MRKALFFFVIFCILNSVNCFAVCVPYKGEYKKIYSMPYGSVFSCTDPFGNTSSFVRVPVSNSAESPFITREAYQFIEDRVKLSLFRQIESQSKQQNNFQSSSDRQLDFLKTIFGLVSLF